MPDLKSNARRAAVPPTAAEAAMADGAGTTLRRALWLDALDQQFHPLLPPGLAPHCRLANVSGGQLVLVTDSPVWRARLRLAEAELLDAARSIGLNPTCVVVKIRTVAAPPAAGTTHPMPSAIAKKAIGDALASLRETDPSVPAEPGAPVLGPGAGRAT